MRLIHQNRTDRILTILSIVFLSSSGYGRLYNQTIINNNKRIYYSEFNITSDIKAGKNCIGTTPGNGFYNPLPMRMWSTYKLRDYLPVGKPVFIARLKLEYNNYRINLK